MSDSCLIIDGFALYVFMTMFVCLILAVILFGCSYLKEAREKDKVELKYKKLSQGYNKLLGMYQREICKRKDV